MGSAADWHAFLDEFRAFGGKAENVMQRKGAYGLGLFPIDPSRPVELHVPDELLVPVEQVTINNGNLVVSDPSSFPEGYGDWFARYQSNYSWGAEAKENILQFEQGLKNLPDSTKEILKRNGIYSSEVRFPGNDEDKELMHRYFQSRCINHKGKRVVMPLIELLNHSPSSKGYDMRGNGVLVTGIYDGEVLVKYNVADPLRRFFGYGFNAPEPLAFSIGCRIRHRERDVVIRGGFSGKGFTTPPTVELKDERLIIQQPLLGSAKSPKMPKTLLIQACMNIEGVDAGELFDQIIQRNMITYINLIRDLKSCDGYVENLLRDCCLDQIFALTQNFGQRDDLLNQASTLEQEN